MNDEELLKGKFSNIFLKLLVGISSRDLKNIKHYLSDDIYARYQKVIDEDKNNNEIHCFDELNVKELYITKKDEDEKYDYIYVNLVSRYMDYFIDSNTLNYKRGINDHRIEKDHELIFRKLKSINEREIVIRCPGCGTSLDVNKTGVCPYCGETYSAELYDYILVEVTNL